MLEFFYESNRYVLNEVALYGIRCVGEYLDCNLSMTKKFLRQLYCFRH